MGKNALHNTRMERREEEKTKKRKIFKRVMIGLAVALVIFLGLFAAFMYDMILGDDVTFSARKTLPIAESRVNILIIGYDSEVNGKPRSDTMMLASFDLEDKSVGIISIPRDTRVKYGENNYGKINAAFAQGGAEMSSELIADLLGVPVDYYVATNFEGFAAMIDTLGGIELDIKERMDYDDNAGDLHIHFEPGRHRLDGKEAVGFVRYRDHVYADLGRIDRQQQFLHEAVNQFMSPQFILDLPRLIAQFKDSIDTNMSFKDMMNLAKVVKNLAGQNIKTARIPGEGKYVHGISYFIHDEAKTKELVNEMAASKKYVNNGKVRVAVLNGNGIAGSATRAAAQLKTYGFAIAETSNADRNDYAETMVIYPAQLTPEIQNIARLLNGKTVSVSEVGYDPALNGDFDVLVIVGKNFKENS